MFSGVFYINFGISEICNKVATEDSIKLKLMTYNLSQKDVMLNYKLVILYYDWEKKTQRSTLIKSTMKLC